MWNKNMFFFFTTSSRWGLERGWETRLRWGRFGCEFSILDRFGGGGGDGYGEDGVGMLKPIPNQTKPISMSTNVLST